MENKFVAGAEIQSHDVHPRKRINILDSAISYIDTGSGEPVVFLHGNPTSSYLWRNIIPYLSGQARCLAPDLIGMGQSGKSSSGYKFIDHVKYLDEWFRQLGLTKNISLVLHDWGSALGFYWASRNLEKIKSIAYMEAIVQPRLWSDFPQGRDTIFRALLSEKGEEMILGQNFFIEVVLPKSIIRQLSADEMEAYRAPFRLKEDRLPTLIFARELPIEGKPAEVHRIVAEYGAWLSKATFPKLLIKAEPGALLTGRNLEFARSWPKQREVVVKGIHYIQEDSPDEIGCALQNFFQTQTNGLL